MQLVNQSISFGFKCNQLASALLFSSTSRWHSDEFKIALTMIDSIWIAERRLIWNWNLPLLRSSPSKPISSELSSESKVKTKLILISHTHNLNSRVCNRPSIDQKRRSAAFGEALRKEFGKALGKAFGKAVLRVGHKFVGTAGTRSRRSLPAVDGPSIFSAPIIHNQLPITLICFPAFAERTDRTLLRKVLSKGSM